MTIAQFVDGFSSLADIACDHGYLGIYCALNYDLNEVLLTDINELPLESAKVNINKYMVNEKVKTALGDGLAPLTKPYDVISISGIGGNLLVNILKKDLLKAQKAKRLILSANNDVKALRKFLMDNAFEIETEVMVDDYKYYEVIICKYVDKKIQYTDLELHYGPYLLQNKSKEFIACYEKLLNTLLLQVAKVNNQDAKINLLKRIEEIKGLLKN